MKGFLNLKSVRPFESGASGRVLETSVVSDLGLPIIAIKIVISMPMHLVADYILWRDRDSCRVANIPPPAVLGLVGNWRN